MSGEWKWWFGTNNEHYSTECADREEAVYIATHEYDGGYIIEARQDPLILSRWFDAVDFLERAEELACEDYSNDDGDALFDATADQRKDLEVMVRAAIDAWQAKHELVFMPYRFTDTRNGEYIAAPNLEHTMVVPTLNPPPRPR